MSVTRDSKYTVKAELPSTAAHLKIFLATQQGLDREVELRISSSPVDKNDPAFRRFFAELKILMNLDHPNMLSILDAGRVNDRVFYTTQYRRAISLEKLLAQINAPMAAAELHEIGCGVGQALSAMHERNLVHRAVDLTNVWFDIDKQKPYIYDISHMARLGSPSEFISKSLLTPEYFRDEAHDAQSDLFLLGVMLYHLATNRPPFPAVHARTMQEEAIDDFFSVSPPSSRNPHIPRAWDALICTLCSPSRSTRFSSASEFLDALKKTCRPQEVSLTSLIGESRRDLIDLVRHNIEEIRKSAEKKNGNVRLKTAAPSQAAVYREKAFDFIADMIDRHGRLILKTLAAGFALVILLVLAGAFLSELSSTSAPAQTRRRLSVLEKQVRRVCADIDKSPVRIKNFEGRWLLLHSYLNSIPEKKRPAFAGEETLKKLHKSFQRKPVSACRALNGIFVRLSSEGMI